MLGAERNGEGDLRGLSAEWLTVEFVAVAQQQTEINPNRSLGPISSGDVKVFSCSPESKECLPLIYGSHKT